MKFKQHTELSSVINIQLAEKQLLIKLVVILFSEDSSRALLLHHIKAHIPCCSVFALPKEPTSAHPQVKQQHHGW